jgi:hypothetical protein
MKFNGNGAKFRPSAPQGFASMEGKLGHPGPQTCLGSQCAQSQHKELNHASRGRPRWEVPSSRDKERIQKRQDRDAPCMLSENRGQCGQAVRLCICPLQEPCSPSPRRGRHGRGGGAGRRTRKWSVQSPSVFGHEVAISALAVAIQYSLFNSTPAFTRMRVLASAR